MRVTALVGAIALLGWGHDLVSVPVVSAAPACVNGWQQMPTAVAMGASSNGAASVAGQPAWWVGHGTNRRPDILRWNGSQWVLSPSPITKQGAFNAVSASSATNAWAVGWTNPFAPNPVSVHWNGTSWQSVKVANPGGQTELNTVAALPNGRAWAAGARLARGHRLPFVVYWNGAQWLNLSPAIPASDEAGILGVATTPTGTAWISGWHATSSGTAAWIASWSGSSWVTQTLPEIDGLAYITDMAFTADTDGWAVGYVQQTSGKYAPLLLHWDGVSWTLDAAPWDEDSSVLLMGATIAMDGTLVISGDRLGNRGPELVMATKTIDGWQVTTAPSDPFPGSWINAQAPTATGAWVATGRTAVQQQAFGAAYQSCAASTKAGKAGAMPAAVAPPDLPLSLTSVDDMPTVAPPPGPLSLSTKPTVDPSTLGLKVRDVTASAGLSMKFRGFSGLAADFNGDTWPDLFLNQHVSGNPILEMGGATGFTTAPNTTLRVGDFFDCAAADVNGDLSPDLFCPTGRRRGTFLGADELHIDVGSTGGALSTQDWGLLDASGRGRASAFVHLAGDTYPHLFVSTIPIRMDAFPSMNRFYADPNGTNFEPDPGAGLDSSLGGTCATAADLDDDGNDEVLFCSVQASSGLMHGARVFSFNGTRFVDQTGTDGIHPMKDLRILVADFNHDGKLDIAQLSRSDLRISLQTDPLKFVASYNLPLTGAVSMGVGDVNGDGAADVYVRGNRSQLMLINNGGGGGFTSIALPPIRSGSASEVVALDFDKNGRTDFLSLNGEYGAGYPQLLAFYPANP